ncbi:MAG TPA: heparan-alpha-glucosaminide N-acetyltransferase domain-containing protein [Flavitalea sp.]|nr:heparan-alpha-glucosaminide N-acetyltransferase domain-containing protein [Flavitalea sp.]
MIQEGATNRYRVNSIDILRGIVMVIMALDHTRDFFHNEAFTRDPLDAATTYPLLYFTRWITHFCAPVFVFLAGTSAYLSGQKKTKKELSSFLFKRGLWLVIIEVVIVSLGISFDPLYNIIFLQVIWAIGISMILLSLLIWLPYKAILTIGFVILLCHNLLDYPEAARNGKVGFWWDLLHRGSFAIYPITDNHVLAILYPFLPWVGVMALGYCFGALYRREVDPVIRRKWLLRIGTTAIVLFIVLRLINAYGNPLQWAPQSQWWRTVLAFLNVQKYPPSLLFTCMTLGPALIVLAFLEKIQNRVTSFFAIYGRVPFFYYILHFYLIHFLCVIAFFLTGHTTNQIVTPQFPFLFRPPTFGFNLAVVYAVWIFVIAVLYPLVKRYDLYKQRNRKWWLSYL